MIFYIFLSSFGLLTHIWAYDPLRHRESVVKMFWARTSKNESATYGACFFHCTALAHPPNQLSTASWPFPGSSLCPLTHSLSSCKYQSQLLPLKIKYWCSNFDTLYESLGYSTLGSLHFHINLKIVLEIVLSLQVCLGELAPAQYWVFQSINIYQAVSTFSQPCLMDLSVQVLHVLDLSQHI